MAVVPFKRMGGPMGQEGAPGPFSRAMIQRQGQKMPMAAKPSMPMQQGAPKGPQKPPRDTGRKTREGRPIYQMPDGRYITERAVIVSDSRINQGAPTVIPTFFNGRIVPRGQATDVVAHAGGKDPVTGRKLQGYPSMPAAKQAASARAHMLASDVMRAMSKPGGAAKPMGAPEKKPAKA